MGNIVHYQPGAQLYFLRMIYMFMIKHGVISIIVYLYTVWYLFVFYNFKIWKLHFFFKLLFYIFVRFLIILEYTNFNILQIFY